MPEGLFFSGIFIYNNNMTISNLNTVEDLIAFMQSVSGIRPLPALGSGVHSGAWTRPNLGAGLNTGPAASVGPLASVAPTNSFINIPPPEPPKLFFSRYDRKLIQSLAKSLNLGLSWTEKQRETALMLIQKYRKQLLEKFCVGVEPYVKDPKFRNEVRILSTERSIKYVNGHFIMKCPFIKEMSETFRRISHLEDPNFVVDLK
jgi:hypothetical protein